VRDGADPRARAFAHALGEAVLQEFLKDPHFLAADPVILGSWARQELAPASDLDLLFLGAEDKVSAVVRRAQEKGIKIRSRLPEDFFDLSKGVELWDQLSLLDGRALTSKAEEILESEKQKILGAKLLQKKAWLRRLREERSQRHERFNSIQNLLEPNLKMGLGGLRDLQQARIIMRLFPQVHHDDMHAATLFDFYAAFFLNLRGLLHFEGQGDLIAGHLQPQLAQQLGFRDYHALMSFVQSGLSRVSFYSDWLLEEAGQSQKQKVRREAKRFQNTGQLAEALLKDPSVLTQYQVRRQMDELWPKSTLAKRAGERGRSLRKFFGPRAREVHWIALFRSRLMDKLIPELKPLIGFVQHDQYNRFTADAHILQVVREVLRAQKSSRHLGGLSLIAKDLRAKDWEILRWTALYHDLAKGRTEDHSELGAKWVKRDLKAFGLSPRDVTEVQWLVQNHFVCALGKSCLRNNT
jgi:[protein-PII] uridylyltransferase